MYYCCVGCCEGLKGCVTNCKSNCIGLKRGCNNIFEQINKVFNKPFSLCVFLTVLFIALPAVAFTMVALFGLKDLSQNCNNPILIWILIACGTILVDTAFCIYMFFVFNQTPKQGQKQMTTFEKLVHFFCKDCVVLFFAIFLLGQFVWSIVGFIWSVTENRQCMDQRGFTMAQFINILIWLFFIFGIFGACFAFFFLSCQQGKYTEGQYGAQNHKDALIQPVYTQPQGDIGFQYNNQAAYAQGYPVQQNYSAGNHTYNPAMQAQLNA